MPHAPRKDVMLVARARLAGSRGQGWPRYVLVCVSGCALSGSWSMPGLVALSRLKLGASVADAGLSARSSRHAAAQARGELAHRHWRSLTFRWPDDMEGVAGKDAQSKKPFLSHAKAAKGAKEEHGVSNSFARCEALRRCVLRVRQLPVTG